MLTVALLIVIAVIDVGAFAALRLGLSRLFGIRAARLFSWELPPGASEGVHPIVRPLIACGSATAVYWVSAALFASSVWIGGEYVTGTRVRVVPGGPADIAGMKNGDRVVTIAGEPVASFDEIPRVIRSHAGDPLAVRVERAGAPVDLTVSATLADGVWRIGVQSGPPQRQMVGVGRALLEGVKAPVRVIATVVGAVSSVVSGDRLGKSRSTVAMVREMRTAETDGRADALSLLGAMNTYYAWPVSVVVAILFVPRKMGKRRAPSAPGP